MSTKDNLDKAKIKQDDEYYTSFADIATELNRWANKLTNKDIILPCDWQILDDNVESITIKFNSTGNRYYVNSVSKITAKPIFNLFGDFSISQPKKEVSEQVVRNLLNKRITGNFINYLLAVGNSLGIKSITASGYDCSTQRGVSFEEIDYSKYNLCITNPPFSKYSLFMEYLMKFYNTQHLDFILIAPFINRIAPCIAVPMMENKVFLGYGRHLPMEFTNPTDNTKKKVAVDWITTFNDAQLYLDEHTHTYGISYVADNYKEVSTMTMKDGTHPIHIKSKTEFPKNYNGWMFVSTAILDDLPSGYEWYCTSCKKYFNKIHPERNPFNHKVDNEMIGYGTENSMFHGIILRKNA